MPHNSPKQEIQQEAALRKRMKGEDPYDYALFLIENNDDPEHIRKWMRKHIEHKPLRRILKQQMRFNERIQKLIEHGKLNKAEKVIKELISPTLIQRWRGKIAEAVADHPALLPTPKPDIASENGAPIVTTHTTETIEKELPIARKLLNEKLGKNAQRYSEEVLTLLTEIIDVAWLSIENKKVRLQGGRTEMLILAELLTCPESVVHIDYMAEHTGLKADSLKGSIRDLERFLLAKTPWKVVSNLKKGEVCIHPKTPAVVEDLPQ